MQKITQALYKLDSCPVWLRQKLAGKKKKSQHKHKVLRENNLLPSEIWAKLMTKKTKPKTKKKKLWAMRNRQQNLYNVYVAGLFWGRIRNGCIAEFHCQPAVLSSTIKGAICKFWYSAYTVKLEGFRGPQYSEMPRHKLKKKQLFQRWILVTSMIGNIQNQTFFPTDLWKVTSKKWAWLHYITYITKYVGWALHAFCSYLIQVVH